MTTMLPVEGDDERRRLQLEADLLHDAAEIAQQKVRDYDRRQEQPLPLDVNWQPGCPACERAERHLRRVQ